MASWGGTTPGAGTIGLVEVLTWRQSEGWTTRQVLRSPQVPGDSNIGFGSALSQNGTTIAISAASHKVTKFTRGMVLLYEQDATGTWALVQTVQAPREGAFGVGYFGRPLDMTDDLLVVGEPYPYGRVHVFGRLLGEWSLIQTLEKPGYQAEEDYFGSALAIDPETETLIVGDPQVQGHATRPGRAHIFERDHLTGQWLHVKTLMASEPWADGWNYNDGFGSALAAFDGMVVVGSPRALFNGRKSGGAESYTRVDGRWKLLRRYSFDEPDASMGWSVETDGHSVVVGSEGWPIPGKPTEPSYAIFVYEESSGDSACGPYPGRPYLNVLGDRSADEGLTLGAHDLPPRALSVFLMGIPSDPQPFGEGRLCVAEPYRLLGYPMQSGPFGTAYLDVPSDALAGTAGLTLAFQCVYSRPDGLLRGTSSARVVTP